MLRLRRGLARQRTMLKEKTVNELEKQCVSCGRKIDAKKEALHYPCYWGCPEPLATLRQEKPDMPVCLDCLPEAFKRGGPGWKPILSADDLPKVGEPLPPNVICRTADDYDL